MSSDPDLRAAIPREPGPVPYTMRIGVTGHRDLINPDAVYKAVENLLCSLGSSFQTGTGRQGKKPTPVKWKVISALAKGSDRIVARVAIEKLGATLEVVLPAAPDEYRKDFTDPSDLAEFNGLFESAVNYPALSTGVETYPANIKEGYEQAGKALVDACEILIAVWDGKPARGQGGTGSIVRYAMSVNRMVVWINALDPELPAVILTEVKDNSETGTDFVNIPPDTVIRALPGHASGWSSRFAQVAEYNNDNAFLKRSFYDVFQRNFKKLDGTAQKTGLSQEIVKPLMEAILPHYSKADSLAIRYRKLHTMSAIWLYRLAAISVTVAVVQALFFPSLVFWTVLEIVALTGGIITFRVSIARRWHEKYLNYRHLAERLRTLLFQTVVGNHPGKSSSMTHLLPFYPGPGGWVPDVVREVSEGLLHVKIPVNSFNEVKRFVNDGWISDQAGYHAKNAARKRKHSSLDHGIIIVLLAGTLAAAITHLLKLVHDPAVEKMIISLVIILPAFASAQHAIGSVRDNERMATRSERMAELLRGTTRSINDAGGWEDLRREIRQAEDIMATENHEWWVSLSFRRVSLPV